MPYLQQNVKALDMPAFFTHLIPLVEVSFASPTHGPTTGTIAPGVLYEGGTWQAGVEALIPANSATRQSQGTGFIVQFHLFLDDIFPNSIGKPFSTRTSGNDEAHTHSGDLRQACSQPARRAPMPSSITRSRRRRHRGRLSAEVRLWFTEEVEPAFSKIEVTDATGARVDDGTPVVDATDRTLLIVGLKKLPPGEYKVHWHVISVDTHATEGNFTFRVGP